MTNQLKNKWITIRANPQNKQHLQALSLYYGKPQSEILRELIYNDYQKIVKHDTMGEL